MVPDRQNVWTDGRHQNYIPLTSSGDNDGGLDHDWSYTCYQYTADLGLTWLDTLNEKPEEKDNVLYIPQVDLCKLNEDQTFAYNNVVQTLMDYYISEQVYQPLWLSVEWQAQVNHFNQMFGKGYKISLVINLYKLFVLLVINLYKSFVLLVAVPI